MLPESSKVKAKMAEDPEIAKLRVSGITEEELDAIIDARSDPEESSVPNEGYTLEISKMDDIINEIRLLRLTLVNVFSKSQVKEPLNQKPKSEVSKILEKRLWEREREGNQELLRQMGF